MKIKSYHGITECHFKDLVAANAAVEQVRLGYRQACIEKPDLLEEHRNQVLAWATRNFGRHRYIEDFDNAVGGATGNEAIRAWDLWIEAQPLIHRKLYYDPAIVAACIMGDDE